MSAEEQHTAFPMAGSKELGYRPDQVDVFLDRARRSYDGSLTGGSAVTSEEVRGTAFGVHRRGYSARYVDAALDRLEEVFFERERRASIREAGEDAWWSDTRELLADVRGRISRPRGKRFRRRGVLATGYRRSQVDALLDAVGEGMARREFTHTPAQLRDVVFHSQLGGYDEGQVDALLDALVELTLSTR